MTDITNLTNEEREALKTQYGISDDELDAKIFEAQEAEDRQDQSGDIPKPPRKDDVLLFLRDVLRIKVDENLAMNRTGNLTPRELGQLGFSTRKYNDVANYADLAGYNGFANYARMKTANIITTSTSKKGFFLQLITTTKKINQNVAPKQVQRSSSLFGGSKEVISGGEESDAG